MENDPLDTVFSYVERAYVRLQAGEVLVQCLELSSTTPIEDWVEGLVLAGPDSLHILHEIIDEVDERKIQASQDLNLIFKDLELGLEVLGVRLADLDLHSRLDRIKPLGFIPLLQDQGIENELDQEACVQILRDAREMAAGVFDYISLLEDIESYLQDWLWGMYYQLARHKDKDSSWLPN